MVTDLLIIEIAWLILLGVVCYGVRYLMIICDLLIDANTSQARNVDQTKVNTAQLKDHENRIRGLEDEVTKA